jgi:hypothetical protein
MRLPVFSVEHHHNDYLTYDNVKTSTVWVWNPYTWQIDYGKLLLREVALLLLFAAAYCIGAAIYQSVITSRAGKP